MTGLGYGLVGKGSCPGEPDARLKTEMGGTWYPSIEAMNRCRLTIYYSGRVQGVGFRFTTKSVAAGYDVVGTVRNLVDGRVELVVRR